MEARVSAEIKMDYQRVNKSEPIHPPTNMSPFILISQNLIKNSRTALNLFLRRVIIVNRRPSRRRRRSDDRPDWTPLSDTRTLFCVEENKIINFLTLSCAPVKINSASCACGQNGQDSTEEDWMATCQGRYGTPTSTIPVQM